MANSKNENGEIVVREISQGKLEVCILGATPLICNRMSQKAMRELLMPAAKKNAAEKASSLKHNPIEEYRASPYTLDRGDALIGVMSTAFKGAIRTTALDTPGATKSQIGRLVYVEGQMIPIFGVPEIFSTITRSADINRTPDVRTRAILPEWACRISVVYAVPLLKEQTIVNLISAAGYNVGVGDWRPEKGAGNYGQFRIVAEDDPDFVRIMATQGRDAQAAALDNPTPHDAETSELLSWFDVELNRRGFKVAA